MAALSGSDLTALLEDPANEDFINQGDPQACYISCVKALFGHVGNFRGALQLLAHGAKALPARTGIRPIHLAAGNAQAAPALFLSVIEKLLTAGDTIDALNDAGATAMHAACSTGALVAVQTLLSLGANPGLRDNNNTPLLLAVELGRPEIIRALLDSLLIPGKQLREAQALVKSRNMELAAPLIEEALLNRNVFRLISTGKTKALRVLLEDDAAVVRCLDEQRGTPLHMAASEGKVEETSLLLKAGADPNAIDAETWTPLHHACAQGHITLLLDAGAVSLPSSSGSAPLRYIARLNAANYKVSDIAAVLDAMMKAKPHCLNEANSLGETALHQAASLGSEVMVQLLLERGADPNASTPKKITPLHWAIQARSLPIVKLLAENPRISPSVLDACIHMAQGEEGKWNVTSVLLCLLKRYCQLAEEEENLRPRRDASINIRSSGDIAQQTLQTPRSGAAQVALPSPADLTRWTKEGENIPLFKAIMRYKTRVLELRNEQGLQLFHLAAAEGRVAILRFAGQQESVHLLVNMPDKHGWTPLHHAAQNGHLDAASVLLQLGAQVGKSEVVSPIYYIARLPITTENSELFSSVLSTLMSRGQDINEGLGSNQETPLHQACMKSTGLGVKLLLKAGANVEIPSKKKLLPLHYAVQAGKRDCVAAVLEHSNRPLAELRACLELALPMAAFDIYRLLLNAHIQAMPVEERPQLIAPMTKGALFRRVNRKGVVKEEFLQVSPEGFFVSINDKKVFLSDVEELRYGQNTDAFTRATLKLPDVQSFSLHLPYRTLNFTAPLHADFIAWTMGITYLLEQHQNVATSLKQAWTIALQREDFSSHRIAFYDAAAVLSRLNIALSASQVKEKLKKMRTGGDEKLSFQELSAVVATMKEDAQPERDLYNQYCSSPDGLRAMDLQRFLLAEQGELVEQTVLEKHCPMEFLTFVQFLRAPANSLLDPEKAAKTHDMKRPLTEYFIASSHNTYLTAGQLTGESSIERYVQDLKSGCRCVELDIWDGPDGEPIIYHGHTLVTKISFALVVKALRDYAFATSPYPVILSFENHGSAKQQVRMSEILRTVLGAKLAMPLSESEARLPSPTDLMDKILIKGGSLRISADQEQQEAYEEAPEEGQTAAQQEAAAAAAKVRRERVKVVSELSDVTFLAARRVPGFEKGSWEPKQPYPLCECISFGETRLLRIVRMQKTLFASLAKEMLTRSYPKAARVDSSNYNPIPFWNASCQLVALNYQTPNVPMWLNRALFLLNGGCGYVLQSEVLKQRAGSHPTSLRVRLISASFLPKIRTGATDDSAVPDVTATLSVHSGEESKEFRTKVVKSNGFNPSWNEEFTFALKPELSFFLISFSNGSDCLAYYALPIHGMRTGYRSCHLMDKHGKALKWSSALLHVTFP